MANRQLEAKQRTGSLASSLVVKWAELFHYLFDIIKNLIFSFSKKKEREKKIKKKVFIKFHSKFSFLLD